MPPDAIALCHEWITTYGGSEQVAARMAAALGVRDVFSYTVGDPALAARLFPSATVRTPGGLGDTELAHRRWQWLLFAMPRAWAHLDLSAYDVVVTSSHAAVNAIRVAPGARHISYCHTPMRYAWNWREEIERFPAAVRPAWPLAAAWLRRADRGWAQNVTQFVANSHHVAARIGACYGRDAVVIYPPIDTGYWTPDPTAGTDDYFLYAGRLVAYKRPEVAVRAAGRAHRRLVVAGSGPELAKLKEVAGPTVTFVEAPDDDALRGLYRRAAALVLPGIEDFGMTLVEAQACGTPVIAFNRGGAREAVRAGETGVLYDDPSIEGLAAAMAAFDPTDFSLDRLRAHARRFDATRFDAEIRDLVAQ